MTVTEKQRYALAIYEAISNLFDEEEGQLTLESTDLTLFFTAAVKSLGLFFNNLTDEDKNALEFTHLLNQLVVQDLLKKDGNE